ncbi:hypothetical protein OESDEN_09700, partial [Oesophagostomum dentatum]
MGYSEDSREVEPLGDSGDNNEQHTYSQRMGRSSIQSRRVNDDTSSSRYFCIVRVRSVRIVTSGDYGPVVLQFAAS